MRDGGWVPADSTKRFAAAPGWGRVAGLRTAVAPRQWRRCIGTAAGSPQMAVASPRRPSDPLPTECADARGVPCGHPCASRTRPRGHGWHASSQMVSDIFWNDTPLASAKEPLMVGIVPWRSQGPGVSQTSSPPKAPPLCRRISSRRSTPPSRAQVSCRIVGAADEGDDIARLPPIAHERRLARREAPSFAQLIERLIAYANRAPHRVSHPLYSI